MTAQLAVRELAKGEVFISILNRRLNVNDLQLTLVAAGCQITPAKGRAEWTQGFFAAPSHLVHAALQLTHRPAPPTVADAFLPPAPEETRI